MTTFCDREMASKAGRMKISRMSASELRTFTTSGGNALLRMYGTPYYSVLGQKSAAKRAEINRLGWQPRGNGRKAE
jgi:hypothetical protein